jgi:hypothetical protein
MTGPLQSMDHDSLEPEPGDVVAEVEAALAIIDNPERESEFADPAYSFVDENDYERVTWDQIRALVARVRDLEGVLQTTRQDREQAGARERGLRDALEQIDYDSQPPAPVGGMSRSTGPAWEMTPSSRRELRSIVNAALAAPEKGTHD